ncbi:MAG: ferredoxin, partial [Deltaproteobacteria bacterium CG17_big_fil_post_rev_8_21_14_2_50_51_6]
MSEKAKVIFQPSGRRGEVEKGSSLIEASRQLGVDIEALCGEKRVCGKCKVRIEEGSFEKFGVVSSRANVSPWQEEEG